MIIKLLTTLQWTVIQDSNSFLNALCSKATELNLDLNSLITKILF